MLILIVLGSFGESFKLSPVNKGEQARCLSMALTKFAILFKGFFYRLCSFYEWNIFHNAILPAICEKHLKLLRILCITFMQFNANNCHRP